MYCIHHINFHQTCLTIKVFHKPNKMSNGFAMSVVFPKLNKCLLRVVQFPSLTVVLHADQTHLEAGSIVEMVKGEKG